MEINQAGFFYLATSRMAPWVHLDAQVRSALMNLSLSSFQLNVGFGGPRAARHWSSCPERSDGRAREMDPKMVGICMDMP